MGKGVAGVTEIQTPSVFKCGVGGRGRVLVAEEGGE